MTKDVLVSVSSFQTAQEETEHMEVINKGNYYKKNDYHYVVYEEMMEGFDQPIKSMMKFKEGVLTVTKKGLLNVNMVFEESRKNSCCYATPYGDMMLGIDTEAVEMIEEEDRICVNAFYSLEANYEHLADCEIHMEICSKDRGLQITS